jgi:hypothetical protein
MSRDRQPIRPVRAAKKDFAPPPAKTIAAALEQVAAEFGRQRAIRRRQLLRQTVVAFAAVLLFGAAGLDFDGWPRFVAGGLCAVCGVQCLRLALRFRRT